MIGYPPAFGPVCRGGECPARGYTWALVCGEGAGPGVPGPYRVGHTRKITPFPSCAAAGSLRRGWPCG